MNPNTLTHEVTRPTQSYVIVVDTANPSIPQVVSYYGPDRNDDTYKTLTVFPVPEAAPEAVPVVAPEAAPESDQVPAKSGLFSRIKSKFNKSGGKMQQRRKSRRARRVRRGRTTHRSNY